jgi:hypothetical protein
MISMSNFQSQLGGLTACSSSSSSSKWCARVNAAPQCIKAVQDQLLGRLYSSSCRSGSKCSMGLMLHHMHSSRRGCVTGVWPSVHAAAALSVTLCWQPQRQQQPGCQQLPPLPLPLPLPLLMLMLEGQ